jgi:hypothetical protein
LRQVLSAKVKQSHDLKRKLGITVWKEFREDMEQGIKNIQETTAYVIYYLLNWLINKIMKELEFISLIAIIALFFA